MMYAHLPRNCELTFREPFYRIERSPHGVRYHIKASVNGLPEQEIRISKKQQLDVIDSLIGNDKKLLNAVVEVDESGAFSII